MSDNIIQPKFSTLYEEIEKRIEKFYDEGSILTENKYIVGFYGENVSKAIKKMDKAASERVSVKESTERFRSRTNGVTIPKDTYKNMCYPC